MSLFITSLQRLDTAYMRKIQYRQLTLTKKSHINLRRGRRYNCFYTDCPTLNISVINTWFLLIPIGQCYSSNAFVVSQIFLSKHLFAKLFLISKNFGDEDENATMLSLSYQKTVAGFFEQAKVCYQNQGVTLGMLCHEACTAHDL